MAKMRLDKYLATYTKMSRKEAKRHIRCGDVQVDGLTVTAETEKVTLEQNICVAGVDIEAKEHHYWMLHKPKGVVSATKDAKESTVRDLLPEEAGKLFPVGRLDKDAEGLLLMTDDGALAHRLLSPAHHVKKTYYVEYEGELDGQAVSLVKAGLDIGEKHLTKPATLELREEGKALLTIAEGKFHQVKKMIAVLGGRVTYLKRLSMAGLLLDETLQPGEYRELTEEEIMQLQQVK